MTIAGCCVCNVDIYNKSRKKRFVRENNKYVRQETCFPVILDKPTVLSYSLQTQINSTEILVLNCWSADVLAVRRMEGGDDDFRFLEGDCTWMDPMSYCQ